MPTYDDEVHRAGLPVRQAMYQADGQRMHPMLMTALSACIGPFPAALSDGIGSQVQIPLATVVVGGMIVGPVMLLPVVPARRLVLLPGDPAEARRPS